MRPLNWGNINAQADGDFQRLPAGAYVARIIAMEDVADREYVSMVYDIAEGEHANYYSDQWGQSHPNAHRVVLSYKDTALGMTKGRLETIAASNPGFDPFAAWDAGRLDMFVNRLVGLNIREEEYEWDGEVKTRLSAYQVRTVDDVRAGKVQPAPRKALDGTASSAPSRPGVGGGTIVGAYSGPIPFDA